MIEQAREELARLLPGGFLAHLASIAGFILAFLLIARLISERRAPANTFAWMLVIGLIPWVGVPLFLVLGGRKLRRISESKFILRPRVLPDCPSQPEERSLNPVANTVFASSGWSPVAGNRIRFLDTGEEEFAELEALIQGAHSSIHITTFILGNDATGRRLVSLLAEKAAAGVRVRLLLDALGCLRTSRSFVEPIRRAGGEVGRFMPVLPFSTRGSANLRNHRKIAIIDQTTALFGGRNLAVEYMGPGADPRRWRDFGARVDGPAAQLLDVIFVADWCFATRQPIGPLHDEMGAPPAQAAGAAVLQVVASGPDVKGEPIYDGILSMIQEAKRSIVIVTPYFIPDDVLLRSLIVKARAGREVTLVVPNRSNHRVADYARRNSTRELRRAGGRVLLHPGMIHSKLMLVDDSTALIGSANFDLRSLFVNFEVGVFVYSKPELQQLREWAAGLMALCQPPPLHDPRRRLPGKIVEELSRLMAPLL